VQGLVQLMEFAIGARDPYTVAHQQRVTRLACALAKEIGLPDHRLEALHLAGSLHDLGKIAVPGEILSKPGQLNAAEFAIIRTHPQVGYRILRPITLPDHTVEIILQHHERMDGSGYPRGLTGRDILLEARILAVADVVEAMCSHRPYRPALALEEALDEISRYRNILYDSLVVDACLRLCTEEDYARTFLPLSPHLQLSPDPYVLRGDLPTRIRVRQRERIDPGYPLFPANWPRFLAHATTACILGVVIMMATKGF
jgi:putative nucleotidyltransferase with HDIG domain